MMKVLLYNLRSAHNVGSILRTCDGAGVDEVYLVGTTPAPTDRFGRKRADIAKTALGAENSVSWTYHESIEKLIQQLHSDGYTLVCVEQTENAVDYKKYKPKTKSTFIFGEEVKGLPDELIHECDIAVYIPMYGTKESLNVSVATGIILFHYI